MRSTEGSNPGSPISLFVHRLSSIDSNNPDAQGSNDRFRTSVYEYALSKDFLNSLSKHKMEVLTQAILQVYKSRFKRQKSPIYGNINKGFTEEELHKFLSCCQNEKAFLTFKLMANLGLRIGEVVRVKLENIDLNRRKLNLVTEKSRKGDSLYLHDKIFETIRTWVELHYNPINGHSGYLLYSEVKCNTEQHISQDWLRNEFRQTSILAGLNETYGESDERLGRTGL